MTRSIIEEISEKSTRQLRMHKKESSFVQGDDRRVGEPKFRVIKCIRWPDRVDAIYVTLYNVVHNSTQSVRGLVPQ